MTEAHDQLRFHAARWNTYGRNLIWHLGSWAGNEQWPTCRRRYASLSAADEDVQASGFLVV